MSDVEEDDAFETNSLQDIHEEIERCKDNPETSRMFVSGWDDPDQDIETVIDPTANPVDHILWAAENCDIDTLKELLQKSPDLVHAQDSDGYTPLHRASYSNHVPAVCYLLSMGADVTMKTQLGWTPLHSACNWNNYFIAGRLLAAGADPYAVSDGGQTPLHLASSISHCKSTLLVLLMRDDGVELAKKHNSVKETPGDLARRNGMYGPLYEMVVPSVSYIKSLQFTCNPYVKAQLTAN